MHAPRFYCVEDPLYCAVKNHNSNCAFIHLLESGLQDWNWKFTGSCDHTCSTSHSSTASFSPVIRTQYCALIGPAHYNQQLHSMWPDPFLLQSAWRAAGTSHTSCLHCFTMQMNVYINPLWYSTNTFTHETLPRLLQLVQLFNSHWA